VQAKGWYRDPYLVHEFRWFSGGQPTKLVRDGGIEHYDPPPAGPPKTELVEAPHAQPSDGSELCPAADNTGRDGDSDTPWFRALWLTGDFGVPLAAVTALIRRFRQRK
jgi:hypothetical protein